MYFFPNTNRKQKMRPPCHLPFAKIEKKIAGKWQAGRRAIFPP